MRPNYKVGDRVIYVRGEFHKDWLFKTGVITTVCIDSYEVHFIINPGAPAPSGDDTWCNDEYLYLGDDEIEKENLLEL